MHYAKGFPLLQFYNFTPIQPSFSVVSLYSGRRWMDDLRIYVLFINISVISGQWADDIKRLYAIESRLRLKRFSPQARLQLVDDSLRNEVLSTYIAVGRGWKWLV